VWRLNRFLTKRNDFVDRNQEVLLDTLHREAEAKVRV